MVIMQNGDQIAGGGLPVITVPYATYIANKAQYDAPDVLVHVPDYPKGKMPASYVAYDTHLGLDDVGNIATKSLGKVEYKSDDKALYPHTVGDYFINKDGEYCKCTSAISVGQTLTKNTNYTVTDIGSEIKGINSDLSGKRIVTGYFSISVTANENKSITSSSDIISGTLPPDLYYTSYTFGGFSNSIPNNISFCVDSNVLKVRMDATNSSVGVNWICVY